MVTVGPNLPFDLNDSIVIVCPQSCVVTNPSSPGSTGHVSPMDGLITKWRLNGGSVPTHGYPKPAYRLRVLTPSASGYTAAGTSVVGVPRGDSAIETFSTHLPVKAGQLVGLEATNVDSYLRFSSTPGVLSAFLEPAIMDGETAPQSSLWGNGYLFPFNADVLPGPRIDGLSPNRGSVAGNVKTVITGDNFAEVRRVQFGRVEADFTVASETEITVMVPPSLEPGSVPVAVVTAAGRFDAAGAYNYENAAGAHNHKRCIVPKLRGRSLKAARGALRKRRCRLGAVRRPHNFGGKAVKVKRQRPRRGAVLPLNAKVEVALGLNPRRQR